MHEEITRSLVRLGFSDSEATVYIALLREGGTTTSQIAHSSGVARASAHDALDHLCRMGLVTPYTLKGEKRFTAEPPERLQHVYHLRRRELELHESEAERLVPQLAAVYTKHAAKPKIRYIEGLVGLRSMQREIECLEDEIFQMVGFDAWRELEDRRMSAEHRSELGRSSRPVRSLLVTNEPIPPLPMGTEVRVISPELAPIEGEVTVCGDRVLLFSYTGNIIAIEITSQAIADTVRATLELAWRMTEVMEGKQK